MTNQCPRKVLECKAAFAREAVLDSGLHLSICGVSEDSFADEMVADPIANWETAELTHLAVGRMTFWCTIVICESQEEAVISK